jgi:hypothetical protein
MSGPYLKALTANRLVEGDVVFWSQGQWVEQFIDAELFTEEAPAEAATSAAKTQTRKVVDAYLIDVTRTEAGAAPVSYRERLRALGPTNELGHGKQAVGGAAIAALSAASGAARSTGRLDLIRRK